jgi:TonB family protein
MTMPAIAMRSRSGGICDRSLFVALLLSLVLHGGALYAAACWGDCICHVGKVVCPKMGQNCEPHVNVKLVDDQKQAPLKPPPPRPEPRPRSEPAVIVENPRPDRPLAARKAGKVVLPDEAFAEQQVRPAEIRLDRQGLPEEVVVRASDVTAPVIATGEIFGHADELTAGPAGAYGLGGTGTGVGVGPFGTEEHGSGTGVAESPTPAPNPTPEPAPAAPEPKGPSRPPRVLSWTDPPYPEQARQQGIEGTTVLKLTVGAAGAPQNVVVARSSGHAALDQAAVAHVRHARFSPALEDGEAVGMTITFRVKFRLVNT